MKPAFAFLALTLFAAPASVGQDRLSLAAPSDVPLYVWLTGTAGGSENGLQGGVDLNIGFPTVSGSATAQYVEGRQFLSDAPLKSHRMISVLYGWMIGDGPFLARVSAGVGYIGGVQHVGWDRDTLVDGWLGAYCNCPEAAFGHLNVPMRADVLVRPFGAMGAGIFIQANYNPTRSFVSYGIQVGLGKLR